MGTPYISILKRFVAAAITAVILFNVIGVFALFKLGQYATGRQMKAIIKAGVEESSLSVIKVGIDSYHLVDWHDSEEFRYNGKMYDVVRVEVTLDGTVTYYCLTDSQETALMAHITEVIKNNVQHGKQPRKNKPLKSMFKVFTKLYHQKIERKGVLFLYAQSSQFADFSALYHAPLLSIITPPPQA